MLKNIPKKIRAIGTPRAYFGDVVYEPGGSCGPRVQTDFQLVFLLEGEVRVEVDDRVLILVPGQAGLFRPGHREYFRFTEKRKSRHSWCSVHPDLVPAELAAECLSAAEVLAVSRRLEQSMELGLSLPASLGRPGPQGLIESIGLTTLHEYVHLSRTSREGGRAQPDALRRALEWIEQSGHEAIDLANLAREAGVSPAQLVVLFKRHLGTTPIRHVWETRTRHGAQLLRETGLTVGEVAYRCGFQTPFHFSRWVRELHGVSPKTLRQQAWGGAAAGTKPA